MKQFLWIAALAAGLMVTLAPTDADAKRLGGARSSGMQRSATPDAPPAKAPAQQQATPNAAAAPVAGAAAATPKRSWMGPIAGLAAGLGLAALFSHLGFGEGFANVMMMLLLALAAFFVIRLLMRRFAGGAVAPRSQVALAGAGAGAMAPAARPVFVDERPGMQREALAAAGPALPVTAAAAPMLPAGFDRDGFERLAKLLFIRLQAANDRADLDDLRRFTTPEMFAELRLDLQDRRDTAQHTDVVQLDARLVDAAEEADRQIVSVRYSGLLREGEAGGEATPFDEVWHLARPRDAGDGAGWVIAGIQQRG